MQAVFGSQASTAGVIKSGIELSIVVPVYNEGSYILEAISGIKNTLVQTGIEYEIIFVNDGSTDNTKGVIENVQKEDNTIGLVSYDENMGKGFAVKQGVLASNGEFVIFIDGDLDISPVSLQECVRSLKVTDLVVGSKRHPLSKYDCPRSRTFLSKCFNLLVKFFIKVGVSDTQVGLKGGKSKMLKYIFSNVGTCKYAFDVEFLKIATLLRLSIAELPVSISMRDQLSSGDILGMARDLTRIAWNYRIRKVYADKLRTDYSLYCRDQGASL